ncbi:MAG: hypothetical protein ACE5GT_11875 [Rhodospirillales bacterium]
MATKRVIAVLSAVAVGAAACSWPPKMPSLPEMPEIPSFTLFEDEDADRPVISCDAATRLNLQALDWDDAKRLDVHILNQRFTPRVMVMTRNTANVVRVFNDDDSTRTFRAKEFFRATAIARIVYDGRDVAENCIDAIRIGPRKWAALHVVPLRQGNFSYSEGPVDPAPWLPFATPSEGGRIIVR